MTFQFRNGLKYFTFPGLEDAGVRHGIFTRHGGTSAAPWSSLNLGGSVGDTLTNVRDNKSRMLAAMDLDEKTVFEVWQVHSDRIVTADGPRGEDPLQKADAILSGEPGVTLIMRFADCVPILLYDPVKRVIGAVHAGWKGSSMGVAGKAALEMQERYFSDPENIVAGIGPSIGMDHYEVGPDVYEAFSVHFSSSREKLFSFIDKRVYLDLWAANRLSLQEAGVTHIDIAGICTACRTDDWYSHRAECGATGRFGALIAL